jgi:hypothetical protein
MHRLITWSGLHRIWTTQPGSSRPRPFGRFGPARVQWRSATSGRRCGTPSASIPIAWYRARRSKQGPYDGPLRASSTNCLPVEGPSSPQLAARDPAPSKLATQVIACAPLVRAGRESGRSIPRTGLLTEPDRRRASVDGPLASARYAPPPPALSPGDSSPTDLATWKMSRIGRARASDESSESTVPPLWLPYRSAGRAGGRQWWRLMAFDVSTTVASSAGASIRMARCYGRPAFDLVERAGLLRARATSACTPWTSRWPLPLVVSGWRQRRRPAARGRDLLSSSAARTAGSTVWTRRPASSAGRCRRAELSCRRRLQSRRKPS